MNGADVDGPGVAANKTVETRWNHTPVPVLAQPANHMIAASRPQVLQHMFVCVTFHWDVQSLTLLRQVDQYSCSGPLKTLHAS